jgi:hypothetical protein
MDNFRLEETENKIDYQGSGFDAQANKNDPANYLQD